MNRLLALLLVLLLPLFLPADEEKKAESQPNALTSKEASDGWLLLFDGETTFGWKTDGEVKVEKGVLVLGGEKATKATTTTLFGDGGLKLLVRWEGKASPTIWPWSAEAVAKAAMPADLTPLASTPLGEAQRPHSPISIEMPAGTRVFLRDVKYQPALPTKLFNGKDLDGWKVFEGKGKKSKFTVTEEGWVNVKDGPGDLQTTKQFDDFVLQLECISNGKHLNSGIFFRCLPGQYQQGYEAQIHNGWTDTPKKAYTLEDFDPETHKSLGKRKVLSAATDYGTGAIYRRVPARRGVAKDLEWFTMTLVAQGRHIATWVNGIQVVDWTDNRPEKENAREGYRNAAGAVSIQGHDPTTNLSFRNIRIAELPRK
jgi:hypothetical protein